MRLNVPEPKIDLYNDGFADHDQLGRKATGDKLSDLVERIDDPMVIALDGAWGSGKSFFLKCWVGEHLKRKGNTTQTVYFDAFEHDFLDDPLIALTGAIAERFESAESQEENQKTERSKKIKKAAWAVGKGALRIGASVATFGATEALSDMGDAVANAVGDEARTFLSSDIGNGEAEKFWTAHEARIAAMKAFRIALTELTEPVTEDQATRVDRLRVGNPTRKLVVVIDELDRCRPDYALSLLEIIKHFFNVPGVHFVLGVNLKELQNSVRARYGSGVDAAKYLQKFVSVEMPLRSTDTSGFEPSAYLKHFVSVTGKMKIAEHPLNHLVRDYLEMANHHFPITLRDVEKMCALLAVIAHDHLNTKGSQYLLAGLIVLKITAPHLVDAAKRNELEFKELNQAFLLDSRIAQGGVWNEARQSWLLATSKDMNKGLRPDDFDALQPLFNQEDPQEVLRLVIAYNLDSFILR
jgi:hypothetical protein